MPPKPPFEFDIRVSADKKRRGRGRGGMSGAVEGSGRICDHPDCSKPGQYRAPKSPETPGEYWWFCREHVREYNLKWNYFAGQSEEALRRNLDASRVWDRPTRPFGRAAEEAQARARAGYGDPHEILGSAAHAARGPATTRRLPPSERRALAILDAREHWTRAEIRKQYKSLVKDLHPDMNGGDRSDEERLQEVVWAWDQLKDSRNFRD